MNQPSPSRRYVLITPCRDEDDYGQRTLESVYKQTVLPTLWVIVDDGSTDDTPNLLAKAAEEHDWIKIIRREDRGKRAVGPGVVDAFYVGLDSVDMNDFDYLCKFDLDLEIPPVYFETLIQRMEAEPRLGTCSGKPYYPDPESGKLISEKCGDEMSVGMTKFYRTTCFQEVGGFVREVMWDGIDCHRCRMMKWIACSWDDEEIRFLHLRLMGSSQKSVWTGRMRHGFGQHFMGTGLLYMTISSVYRMTRPPVLVGGLAMWWGYVSSALKQNPRYDDLEFRKFLRSYQWNCLLKGKAKATQELHDQAREYAP
ncbi:glycosyltransferase family A protein [Kiritimatiellaeota bacterium B1221]|nr:glycosyltransferase family A protein [Kiritimatiellaeota bacterium B1221]